MLQLPQVEAQWQGWEWEGCGGSGGGFLAEAALTQRGQKELNFGVARGAQV